MKNKGVILTIVAVFLFLTLVFTYSFLYIKSKNGVKITDDFIVVFKGNNGKKEFSTYVYEKNKSGNYKYINTKITTNNFDNNNSYERILKTGTTKSFDKLFEIAKNNTAYDYVIVKGIDEHLSIDDFKDYLERNGIYEK